MEIKTKRILAILLAVCFLVSLTASAASAVSPVIGVILMVKEQGTPSYQDHEGNAWGVGHDNAGGNPDHGSNVGGNRWGNDKYTTNEMPFEEK